MPHSYDFERVIDDFVFMCFFVGNDFLPHLPSLSIHEGALDMLIYMYKKALPTLSGYLTDFGKVWKHNTKHTHTHREREMYMPADRQDSLWNRFLI